MNGTRLFELDNRIRVVHKRLRHSRIVHCGIMINAGTRDENKLNNGVAHFIEHAAFNGTERRKAYHILNRVETVGGELNAFTDKEKIFFYATALKTYAERVLELLVDIAFNATFPQKEMLKEKRVIHEEIDMYEDMPEESLFDVFCENAYPEHPLGYNILGTHDTINRLDREDIFDFVKNNFLESEMVISIVGNITPQKVEKLISRYLTDKMPHKGEKKREPCPEMQHFHISKEKEFQQAYAIYGFPALSYLENGQISLRLLNSILGGGGMNSRLNMEIREKFGFVYHIGSNNTAYQDSGHLTIELATDKQNLDRCKKLIIQELDKLKNKKLGKVQLTQAKRQFMGQAAMAAESGYTLMHANARYMLDYNKPFVIEELFEEVEGITAQDLMEIAQQVFDIDKMSTVTYLP